LTFTHKNTTRTNTTTGTAAPAIGGSFTAIGSITTNARGHVTAVDTKTITLPPENTSYDGDTFSIDTGALTGSFVISDLDINITTDTKGNVTDANGTVSTRHLKYINTASDDDIQFWTGTINDFNGIAQAADTVYIVTEN